MCAFGLHLYGAIVYDYLVEKRKVCCAVLAIAHCSRLSLLVIEKLAKMILAFRFMRVKSDFQNTEIS